MPVSIVAEKNGVFQFSPDIPEHLKAFMIKGADSQVASGVYGYVLMQQMQAQQFQVHYNRYCFSHDEQINFMAYGPMLELVFNLDAPVSYHLDGLGSLSFLTSSYNVIYLPAHNHDIYFDKDTTYQTFSVLLPHEYLISIASHFPLVQELLKKISLRQAGVLYQLCPGVPADVLSIIQEILKGKYSGDLLPIYLMAKITELLLLCFEHEVGVPTSTHSIHLWKADLDGIEATRKHMLENPQQPFNLPELALKVGMNKDKLAKGFRLVVGTPIFDFLLQSRMSKAKLLLLTTEFSVSSVGYEVGYQDIHSFSKAFKKFYGLSPHQYRKKFDKGPWN